MNDKILMDGDHEASGSGGVKRPREEAAEAPAEPEATVTMVDVLREQRELEQEAQQGTLGGWGDESRCTFSSVRTLPFLFSFF